MELTGKLIEKLELKSGTSQTGKQWQKLQFVLQEKSVKFPNKIACMTFNTDVIQFINDTTIGTDVTIAFQPKSREYNGSWYTDIQVFSAEINKQSDVVIDAKDILSEIDKNDDPADDLPFHCGESDQPIEPKEMLLTPQDKLEVFRKNESFNKLVETFELELS